MHKKIRELILKCANNSKASHIGSALSIVEILEAIYFNVSNISKDNFDKVDRDIKSLSVQQKTYTMPRFKFWQSIGQFIKFNIALALFVIPVFIIPAVIVLFTVGTNPEYQYVWVILCVIMLIALCFFCFYSFAMFWLFTNKGYWTSFVRFKDVFTLINRNRSRYLDTVGVGVLGFILTLVAIGIVSNPYFIHISGQATQTTLAINDLLPIILTSIIGTYSMFVCAYLVAKCISVKELDLNQDAEPVS